MSSLVVARKDFQDAVRSRLLWGVTALFVLLVGGLAVAFSTILSAGDAGVPTGSSLWFVVFLQGTAGFFVSIAALLVGYKAVAGERESGTISFLLGLPHTRRDVVVGKVLGRSAVLVVALLAGFLVAAVVLIGVGGDFAATEFALFTLLTAFYAVAFVSAAVALSSITAGAAKAAALAIGFWVLNRVWGVVSLVVLVVVSGFSFPDPPLPDWYHVLAGLGPGAAYGNAAAYFLPPEFSRQVQTSLGGLPAWYGLVVLAGWTVVPLLFGIWQFERVDL